MRFHWIVLVVSTLVSLGLLLITVGQYEVIILLNKGSENLQIQSVGLNNQYINEDLFKVTMEKLLVQGTKVVEDLEVTVAKLNQEIGQKKKEIDICQAEKKKTDEELAASTGKERSETEAALKSESDAWTQEINTLRAQLTGYRPICDHVKEDPLALKICGNKTTS